MRSNAYCGNLLWQSSLTLQAPVGAKLPNTRGRGKVQRGGAFCTEAKHLRAARRVEIWNTSLVNDRANAKVEDEYGMYKRSKGYRFWLPCHAVR